MKKVLIIIPCYNEQYAILQTIKLLKEVICGCENVFYDILVVNDGSNDASLEEIKKAGVSYLNLPVNLGIGGAMQTGFIYAEKHNFDVAVQLDGDGQHNPKYIFNLVSPVLSGLSSVVIGSRFIHNKGFQSTKLRRIGIRYFSWLNKILLGRHIFDVTSGFRALDANAIKLACSYYPETYPEPESLVLYHLNNLKVIEVPVEMNSRETGRSSIAGFNTLFYMFKVTFGILFLYSRLKLSKND